jgi:hypothetical protein
VNERWVGLAPVRERVEEFYHAGRQVGWAIYLDGRLHYWNEQILDDGRPVASKNFEGERWRLAFYCGETVSRAIDERTGELSVLGGGVRACSRRRVGAPPGLRSRTSS